MLDGYTEEPYSNRFIRAHKTILRRQMKVNPKQFGLVLIVSANFFIFRNFFIQPGVLVQGTDALMWVTHAKYYGDFKWLHLWYDRTSLGFVKQATLLEDLFGIAYTVFGSPSWTYRVLILAIGVVAGLSVYLYLFHYTGKAFPALCGALFYTLNPLFLREIQEGHLDLLVGMALFPLLLYTFDKGQVIGASIVASLFVSSAHPQALFVFGLFFLFYFIVSAHINRARIIYFVKFCICTFALSAFYLVPTISVGRFSGYGGLVSGWMIEDISFFVIPLYLALLILIGNTLFLLVAFFSREKTRRREVFVLSSFFVAVVATSPSYPILSNLYIWLFQNIPFFNIFRVPYRFLMLMVLCDSYLIGLVLRDLSEVRVIASKTKLLTLPVSRALTFLAVGVMAFVMLFGWWQLPYTSPGNYSPSQEWTAPFYWLGQEEGAWRVYTLGGKDYWIRTPWGVTQEYGKLSTLFTGKSVIGVPSEASSSFSFLKYLEYVASNNVTDRWLRVIGAFDVKYVTLAPYAVSQRNFLQQQIGIRKGASPVYSNDLGAMVYENPYWMPLIYGAPKIAYVVDGYECLPALLNLPGFESDCLGIQLLGSSESVSLNDSSMLIYSDASFMDCLMITYEEGIVISAHENCFAHSRDPAKYWVKNSSWVTQGGLVFSDYTLTTTGDRDLTLPFSAEEAGTYEIWVRMIAGLPNQGHLTINNVTFCPKWSHPTFKWFNFSRIQVEGGEQSLHIRNFGGRNDIDVVKLVRSNAFREHRMKTTNDIKAYAGKVVFLSSGHRLFSIASQGNWTVPRTSLFSSDGYVLHSEIGGELETNLYIPKSGNYSFFLRVNTNGTFTLKIGDRLFQYFDVTDDEYKVFSFESVYLERGNQALALEFDGPTNLDLVAFSTEGNQPENSLFSKVNIDYHKLNPSEYIVYSNSSHPYYLIFSNSFNDSWKAYVKGDEIAPIKMYGEVLGFYINQTGSQTMRLVFTKQKYTYMSFAISLVAWCAVGIYILSRKTCQKFNWREYLSQLKLKLSKLFSSYRHILTKAKSEK